MLKTLVPLTSQNSPPNPALHMTAFGNPSHVDHISVSMFKSEQAKLVLLNCQSVKNSCFSVLVRLVVDVFNFIHFITRMRFLLRKMTMDIYFGIDCLWTFIKAFMPTQSPSTDVPC